MSPASIYQFFFLLIQFSIAAFYCCHSSKRWGAPWTTQPITLTPTLNLEWPVKQPHAWLRLWEEANISRKNPQASHRTAAANRWIWSRDLHAVRQPLSALFCIWESQTVREEKTVPYSHKINYFNPFIVVSCDHCACCSLSSGAFGSLQPAQLVALQRWSVLCKYKQLLYQLEQPPRVAYNKAMLNEY